MAASAAGSAANAAASAAEAAVSAVDAVLDHIPVDCGINPMQRQMFAALMDAPDCLLVTACGLGLDRLLLATLAQYCDPRMLVPVLNLQPMEQQLLVDALTQLMPAHPPLVITNEQQAPERHRLYLRGGVVFVTSRIFVVDLLHNRAPMESISGIVVANADRVTRLSTEAFILRLYRNANRAGFIKAVTDQAQGFNAGFNAVERTMRALWVSKLNLWPYFTKEVLKEIERVPMVATETRVAMTDRMRRVQQAIFDIMTACLKQLKRLRPSLDVEQLTIERNLFKSAEANIKRQLNVEWHTIDASVRQIVRELKMLRELVMYLDQYDCVSFYHHLSSVRANTEVTNRNAYWYQLDAASELLDQAKYRVFPPRRSDGTISKKATVTGRDSPAGQAGRPPSSASMSTSRPAFSLDVSAVEVNPKWESLAQILREIRAQRSKAANTHSEGQTTASKHILVCTRDRRTAVQLSHYLTAGAEAVLRSQLALYYKWKSNAALLASAESALGVAAAPIGGRRGASRRARAKRRRDARHLIAATAEAEAAAAAAAALTAGNTASASHKRSSSAAAAATAAAASSSANQGSATRAHAAGEESSDNGSDDDDGSDDGDSEGDDEENMMDDSQAELAAADDSLQLAHDENFQRYFRELTSDDLLIVPLQHEKMTATGHAAVFAQLLRDVQPQHVVFYDPYLPCARELQLFQAAHPEIHMSAWMMLFNGSFQEQQYLSSIRHEKEAFQQLIATKRTMAIPVDQDGREGLRQLQERQLMRRPDEENISSRRAGGRLTAAQMVRPKIIVDMREFRSSLPGILYEFGIDVEPRTLLVGDYVLSPDMCVERKSYTDLVGSLNSGRLHDQAASMTRYYSRAALLIEFDEERPISSVDVREAKASADIDIHSTMAKLTLLTLTFPKLRLLWSHSPHATAKLFFTLKANSREPDGDVAASIGLDGGTAEYAPEPQAVLQNLPGVTPYNIYRIMEKVTNLRALISKSVPELQEICGRRNGIKLHAFLHSTPQSTHFSETRAVGLGSAAGQGAAGGGDDDEDDEEDEAELLVLERQEQEERLRQEDEVRRKAYDRQDSADADGDNDADSDDLYAPFAEDADSKAPAAKKPHVAQHNAA